MVYFDMAEIKRKKIILVTNSANIPLICCDARGSRRYPQTGFVATSQDLAMLGGLIRSAVKHRDAEIVADAIHHPEASIMTLRKMESQKIKG